MWLLLAYYNYYPSPNNIVGMYETKREALEALERYCRTDMRDRVEIEFQEIGDSF